MRFCKFIGVATVVTGLAMVPGFAQSGNNVELDEGGRRVSLKPIGEAEFGGYAQSGWTLAGGLAGVVLLGSLGALLTSKALK